MEGMRLFELTNAVGTSIIDLTNYIVVPTYKVNNKPHFTEWTDGDLVLHRDVQRYYLEGSFTLLFTDIEDYQNFLTRYKQALNATGEGNVYSYVYSNNDHELNFTKVFMDFELANEMPFMGIKEIDGIEVNIREV